MASLSSSSSVTVSEVGSDFVQMYYKVLQRHPELAHRLYTGSSTMIRVDVWMREGKAAVLVKKRPRTTGNVGILAVKKTTVKSQMTREDSETVEDFTFRFTKESSQIPGASDDIKILGFIYCVRNDELVKNLTLNYPKTFLDMIHQVKSFVRGEKACALLKDADTQKPARSRRRKNRKRKRSLSRAALFRESRRNTFSPYHPMRRANFSEIMDGTTMQTNDFQEGPLVITTTMPGHRVGLRVRCQRNVHWRRNRPSIASFCLKIYLEVGESEGRSNGLGVGDDHSYLLRMVVMLKLKNETLDSVYHEHLFMSLNPSHVLRNSKKERSNSSIKDYFNMTVKALVEAHDGDMYSPFRSPGLRYLIEPGATKETETRIISRVNSNMKARRNCASDFDTTISSMTKGPRQLHNYQNKDMDRVVQRPRAVLSSPDNDHWIREMNKRTIKSDSTPKAPARRVKSTCVDRENAPTGIRDTRPTCNTQYRPKIKDYTKSSVSKDKDIYCKTKMLVKLRNVIID
ncbi:hypothetical protein M8C21_005189 [Ambrosia artemisiifolia]|uniref:NTF2 domain-containing protein n=1 Tax=Ambrosia artemisiifolia TaxID=4212 RepID=A0AAD5GB77_AMBAR|nr:hypothetical protein M8C21_005189 [Ambrosia artemisiifolia]